MAEAIAVGLNLRPCDYREKSLLCYSIIHIYLEFRNEKNKNETINILLFSVCVTLMSTHCPDSFCKFYFLFINQRSDQSEEKS